MSLSIHSFYKGNNKNVLLCLYSPVVALLLSSQSKWGPSRIHIVYKLNDLDNTQYVDTAFIACYSTERHTHSSMGE